MIDIITYSDNNYQEILKQIFFIPTFKLFLGKDFNHIDFIEQTNIDNLNELGFGSDIFQYMIYNRWQILINHIEKSLSTNKISIFSDIDIIFLDNFKSEIDYMFASDGSKDIYFMPEQPQMPNGYNFFNINAGFFVFRHTEKVLNFFKYILDFMKKQKIKEDQFYIQKYLKNNNIEFVNLLNYNYFNTNNCDLHLNFRLRDKGSLKVFHATSCININQKIEVLFNITSPIHKKMLSLIQ